MYFSFHTFYKNILQWIFLLMLSSINSGRKMSVSGKMNSYAAIHYSNVIMENDQRLSQFINFKNICYYFFNIWKIYLINWSVNSFYIATMDEKNTLIINFNSSTGDSPDFLLAGKKRTGKVRFQFSILLFDPPGTTAHLITKLSSLCALGTDITFQSRIKSVN